MKKGLWASYLEGIRYETPGERYSEIIRYAIPECVTALILYSLASVIDARFVAQLASSDSYAVLSVTGQLLNFAIKVAEGVSVGTMVLCGLYHGQRDAQSVGRALSSSLVLTLAGGLTGSLLLARYAETIYRMMRVPESLIPLGVPFLRIHAISIFFMFLFFTLIGFLRGIKQNTIAMRCFLVGIAVFIFADYILIFGRCGLPAYCLLGSAIASVIQYVVMVLMAIGYIWFHPQVRSHFTLQFPNSFHCMFSFFQLSWPVVGDKIMFALARILVVRNIAPMGALVLSSFGVIRQLEMLAFVPAIACAQVVTFLVSNHLGAREYSAMKYTIKKTLLVATVGVGLIILFFSWQAPFLIGLFDRCNRFTDFAVSIFRTLCILMVCDVVQVVLAGALRGAAQARVVLWVRMMAILCFCMPLMYAASFVTFRSDFVRLMTVYAPFYVGNGLMALWYIYWLRSNQWRNITW